MKPIYKRTPTELHCILSIIQGKALNFIQFAKYKPVLIKLKEDGVIYKDSEGLLRVNQG